MIDDKKMITVANKSSGSVVYNNEELRLRREFKSGEIKRNIPFGELRQLSYSHGGEVILRHYLTIMDEEAVTELLGEVEPEYFYTKKEIEDLLRYGSLDALEDCLNFAPEGVLDMIKSIAVDIQLNAVDKRDLISKKLNFNVSNAIEFSKEEEEDKKKDEPVRKAAEAAVHTETPQASGRKAPTPAKAKVGVVKVVKE